MADQRKSKRFELKLPVELIRAGSLNVHQVGETCNVSSGGVLFSTVALPVEVGQSIEYLISLPSGGRIGDVRLHCMGKVVRKDVENQVLAATLERYEFVRASAVPAIA